MKGGLSWCNECEGSPASLVRVSSETEKYLTGDNTQNAAIKSRLSDKYGEMTVTQDTALVLREPTEIELKQTGESFTKMVEGFGLDISTADLHLAAQLSTAGFIPQHFNIVHGGLYMNVSGWLFWTKRSFGAMDGGSDVRPMNEDERKAYKINDDQDAFIAHYYKIVGETRFQIAVDFGKAGGKTEQNPLAKSGGLASEIAQKRALVRVMRQAAPLGVNIGTFDSEVGGVVDETVGPIAAIAAPAEDGGPPIETEPTPAPAPEGERVKVSTELAEITIEKIEELGITKDDIGGFNYLNFTGGKAVIEMLRDGYDADAVGNAVKLVLDNPVEEDKAPAKTVSEDGTEDVEELPW